MLTNELRKGDNVELQNGWKARIEDNQKGNIRLCTVYGLFTEMGSVYSHDIVVHHTAAGYRVGINHTPTQLKLKARVEALGF
jgi:nitrogen fixation protein